MFEIVCIGTGHHWPELTKEQYIGTLPVGPYIFHYFLTEGSKRKDMFENLAKMLEDELV